MPTKLAALPVLEPEDNPAILAEYFPRDHVVKAFGKCLRTWLRMEENGDGPPRTVIGKKVFYRRTKFKEWLLRHEERPGIRLSANGRPRKPVAPASRTRNARRTRRAA